MRPDASDKDTNNGAAGAGDQTWDPYLAKTATEATETATSRPPS